LTANKVLEKVLESLYAADEKSSSVIYEGESLDMIDERYFPKDKKEILEI
jgi:hypothetical protein